MDARFTPERLQGPVRLYTRARTAAARRASVRRDHRLVRRTPVPAQPRVWPQRHES